MLLFLVIGYVRSKLIKEILEGYLRRCCDGSLSVAARAKHYLNPIGRLRVCKNVVSGSSTPVSVTVRGFYKIIIIIMSSRCNASNSLRTQNDDIIVVSPRPSMCMYRQSTLSISPPTRASPWYNPKPGPRCQSVTGIQTRRQARYPGFRVAC